MQNPNAEFAVMPITISNDDVDNVVVTTYSGAVARGVVVTDDGSPPPFRAEQVQVFAQPMEPTDDVHADWTEPHQRRLHL